MRCHVITECSCFEFSIDLKAANLKQFFRSWAIVFYRAYHLKMLFFVLLAAVLFICNPLRSYRIDVNIFLDEPNADTRKIVQKAVERYQFDHGNILLEKAVFLNFKLVTYNKVINSLLTPDQDRFQCNLTASLCSTIFVHISNHELVLSSLMERSNIVTVGLFRKNGTLTTQVSVFF